MSGEQEKPTDDLGALIRSARTSAGKSEKAAAPVPVKKSGWVPWNATDPAKFTQKHLGALRKLHEKTTRELNNKLSARMRGTIIRVGDPQFHSKSSTGDTAGQTNYKQYIDDLKLDSHNEQGRIGVVLEMREQSRVDIPVSTNDTIDPEAESRALVLAYDRKLAFTVIDLLMGGTSTITADKYTDPGRPLNDVERVSLAHFNDIVATALTEAWQPIDATIIVAPVRDEIKNNINLVAAPTEVTVEIIFQVNFGPADSGIQGNISVGLPYATLMPYLEMLSPEHFIRTEFKEDTEADRDESLDRVPLSMRLEWGRTALSARDMSQLRIGDVLLMSRSASDKFLIYIGNYPRYLAELGQWQGKLVARVVRVLTPEEQDYAARPGGRLPELPIPRKALNKGSTQPALPASVGSSDTTLE